MKKPETKYFNGPALLVGLFRELDPLFRATLLQKLKTASPILARLVDEFEFVYSDLLRLDAHSLQLLLRTVPEDQWLLAWKLTSEPLRQRFLENMSPERRADFMAAAAAAPRVQRQQVYRVQVQIARQAYALLKSGKLKIHAKRPLRRKS